MSERRPPTRRAPPAAGRAAPRRVLAPWAYADEIVLDRRTRAIPAGTVVELQDAERRPLGRRRVQRRLEDRRAAARPRPGGGDRRGWFAARLARALALREALYDAPFYRLVHAEADGLPGVVDRPLRRRGGGAAERRLGRRAARRRWSRRSGRSTGVSTVVKNAGGRARALEGLDDAVGGARRPARRAGRGADERRGLSRRPRRGPEDRPLLRPAPEPRLRRPARARAERARRLLPRRRLRARRAGRRAPPRRWRSTARRAALELAARGAAAGGAAERFDDASAATPSTRWRGSAAEGRRFGLVVCDPPAFAPNKAALEAGLRAYERVARLGGGAGRAGRLPGALLLQPRRRPRPLPRGEPARRGAGRARGADPARRRGRAGPSGASGAGRDLLPQGAVPAARRR